MKDFKYKTAFSSVIKPVISSEKGLYLAKASLDQLQAFIPNIDMEANYDLLPVAFNLFNVNRFNKNDDGVDTAFALKVYKTFINKPINLNHSRENVYGCILTAHLTEFGTDKPLTEEDVKETKEVFNVTVGGVLWRIVNEDLADMIEDSNSILDENYNKIFASFEVGFTDYKIVKVPANSRDLAKGSVIEDEKDIESLSKTLRSFGGTGKLADGSRVFRLLSGDGIGLGGAITEDPAAFLNPVAVSKHKEGESFAITTTSTNSITTTSTNSITLKPGAFISNTSTNDVIISSDSPIYINQAENKEIISHLEKPVVIQDNQLIENDLRKYMKINSIKDINDDLLKEAKASAIVDFIETELKTASEKFVKEKQEKEVLAQEVQKKHEELLKTHEQLVLDLDTLKATLQKLENEKIAREKQEKFNVRMASFESKYELSQDEMAVVASQIKDVDDDQFKSVEANLHILLKNKDKEVVAANKKLQEAKASENKDSKTESQTIDNALDKAVQTSKEIAATTDIKQESLKTKFAKAFAPDQFTVIK